jgi:hypothetical protein
MGCGYPGREIGEMASVVAEDVAFFVGREVLVIGKHEVAHGIACKFDNIALVQLLSRVDKIHTCLLLPYGFPVGGQSTRDVTVLHVTAVHQVSFPDVHIGVHDVGRVSSPYRMKSRPMKVSCNKVYEEVPLMPDGGKTRKENCFRMQPKITLCGVSRRVKSFGTSRLVKR